MVTHPQRMLNGATFLNITGQGVGLALLMVLLARSFHRRPYFPFFFAYIVFSSVISAALVIFERVMSSSSFEIMYWMGNAGYGLLGLAVIHEVFQPSLEMYFKEYRWLRWLLPVPVLAIAGIGASIASQAHVNHPAPNLEPGFKTETYFLTVGAYYFGVGAHCLEALIFILSLRLGWRKRHLVGSLHRFGIIVGFGVLACGELLSDLAAKVGLHINFQSVWLVDRLHASVALSSLNLWAVHYLSSSAYLGANVAWLVTFIRPERSRPPATMEEIQRRQAMLGPALRRIKEQQAKEEASNDGKTLSMALSGTPNQADCEPHLE